MDWTSISLNQGVAKTISSLRLENQIKTSQMRGGVNGKTVQEGETRIFLCVSQRHSDARHSDTCIIYKNSKKNI